MPGLRLLNPMGVSKSRPKSVASQSVKGGFSKPSIRRRKLKPAWNLQPPSNIHFTTKAIMKWYMVSCNKLYITQQTHQEVCAPRPLISTYYLLTIISFQQLGEDFFALNAITQHLNTTICFVDLWRNLPTQFDFKEPLHMNSGKEMLRFCLTVN